MSKPLIALLCATAALASTRADAAETCISPKITESLAACTKVEAKATSKHDPPKIAAPPAPTARSTSTPKPSNETASDNAKDLRRALAAPRSLVLLISEIKGLEALIHDTPKTSPDRPQLLRRAADDYVEAEGAYFAEKIKNTGPKGNKTKADQAAKSEAAARGAAIKYFTTLKDGYPKHCRNNNTGCTDEVLYDLAYELEQDKQPDLARKAYLELIKNWPTSPHVPSAYLAFGELFFNEAQADPSKWPLAEQAYQQVLSAPSSNVHGYAHYKLGYVEWNKGDYTKALSELKKAIEFGTQNSSAPGAKGIAASARNDFVVVYAISGDAKKAFDLFRPLSGDGAGEVTSTLKMMQNLGQAYLDTGHYTDAIATYQELMRRDTAQSCSYQSFIVEAVLASRSADKPAIRAELDKLRELKVKMDGGKDAAVKLACSSRAAELIVETAMSWHLEAVGTGGVRGTSDPKTMDQAASLYQAVLQTWTAEDFAKVEFSKIIKEDRPTLAKVAYLGADLLYARHDWEKCGPAFDAVVAAQPTGELASESLYTSAVCYQNVYFQTHEHNAGRQGLQGQTALSPRDLTDREKAMLASFDRYLCSAKPAADDKEGRERVVEIGYARARTYFDARHFEEAAAAFRLVAMDHPDTDAGTYAAQLYLESLNVLRTHDKKPCLTDLARDTPVIVRDYCKGPRSKENAEQCVVFERVSRDIEREGAAALVQQGQDEKSDAVMEKGGDAYWAIWKTSGEQACLAEQPACERMDEVIENAARAYQAAHFVAKAIAARKVLIDPRYHLEKTATAKKAVHSIGAMYQALAIYDEAAKYYEKFALDIASDDQAVTDLADAVVLWLGLGEEERAIKAAQQLDRQFGTKKPALSAQVAYAIGDHFAEHGDFAKAKQRLSAAMALIDRSGTLDVRIRAHATLGRAMAASGGVTAASAEYSKVRSLVRDGKDVEARLSKLDADEPARLARLAPVLMAFGEAQFFFAEEKRKEVDRIHLPEYKGSGKHDDVQHFVNTKVAEWIKKKQPAIEAAEREYRKIKEITPQAPPKWVVAAGSRVGQMWGKFVAEFRAAPTPIEWTQHGPSNIPDLTWEEIRAAYGASIDEASEPYRKRAKAAFETCLQWSVEFRHFDDRSRTCEDWLSKNAPNEYHAVDELRQTPTWLGERATYRPAVLPAPAKDPVTKP